MDLYSTKSSLTGEKTLLALTTEQETYMPVQGRHNYGQQIFGGVRERERDRMVHVLRTEADLKR